VLRRYPPGGSPTLTGYDYTYDTRGRLTDVKKAGVLVSHYDYDPNGNRLAPSLSVVAASPEPDLRGDFFRERVQY
jgi:YD repeat-containing protein